MNCRLYFIILIVFLSFLFASCDKSSSSFDSSKSKEALCVAPNNPFNDGGGHDAGFNWAQENGGSCDGHSEPFNEGCAEYYKQLNEYNSCIAQKK